MDIQNFLFGTLSCSMLLAFCISVGRHKCLPLVLKPITWYLLVELIVQVAINSITWWYPSQNKYFLFHIAFVLEAVILLLMYRELFKKYVERKGEYAYRKIFIALIIAFVLFAIANAIWLQPLTIYPNNIRVVLSIIIVIFSIQHHIMITARATRYYYLSGMNINISDYGDQKEIPAFKLTQAPMFWINTGLQFFTTATLILSIFGGVFLKSSKLVANNVDTPSVHAVFAIVLYTFIGIAFIKAEKMNSKKKS